jgi:hypothetical protein
MEQPMRNGGPDGAAPCCATAGKATVAAAAPATRPKVRLVIMVVSPKAFRHYCQIAEAADNPPLCV